MSRVSIKKARLGQIEFFTGISDPYEEPLTPEIVVDTEHETPEESLEKIWAALPSVMLMQK